MKYLLPSELRSEYIHVMFWSESCKYREHLTAVHANRFDNSSRFKGVESWGLKIAVL